MRADRAYWARLRRDARSNWAAGLATLAALAATVAVVTLRFGGAPGASRLEPVYWLMLAPVAWLGASLASFERWAVRLLLPVAAASPLVCVAVLASASERSVAVAAFAVSLIAAIGAFMAYRGSLLRAEGPAR